jgi:hypothetical protein
MANVYVYIDGSRGGLPDAAGYYRTFPREPSRLPADDIAIDPSRMTVSTRPSAEEMLDLMLKVGTQGHFMIVCHAWLNGLHLPILGGDTAYLTADTMDSLDKVMDVEARAAKARAMPDNTDDEKKAKLEVWRQLIGGLDATLVQKPFTLDQAEALYEKGFDKWAVRGLDVQKAGGVAALRRLLEKIKKVRALGLGRVEFRACKIGDNESTMKVVKNFFKCRRLLAPMKETFYLGPVTVLTLGRMAAALLQPKDKNGIRPRPTITVPTRPHGRGRGRLPGPTGTDVLDRAHALQVIDSATTRSFVVTISVWSWRKMVDPMTFVDFYVPGPVRAWPEFFNLTVNETTRWRYQGFAGVAPTPGDPDKPNREIIEKFVQKYVMPNVSAPIGGIPFAGFWMGDKSLPFILPNEDDYRRQIKEV